MPLTLLIIAASVLAVVVVGTLLVRSRLRPVRLLSDAVQHVVEAKDFQPVAVPRASGEVARLTSWFNHLLRMVARMRERHTRLVLDAGHELRNPLTSLRTNVDLLAVDLGEDRLSVGQRTEIVGDVQAQLGELSGLVTDLTHLARDEDEVAPSPVDVCELVRGAVERVRLRGQDRVFDVELQPLFMVGHADALSRVFVNLLDNAVKWSPSGGTVRVRVDGNRLRVSDDGPGIPEADLPYVFDRFFRGQTGRGTPGTGLGLSIVAKTVEDHGGSVRAARSSSGGAEFTVQLPGATSLEALSGVLHGSVAELSAARSAEAAAVEAAGVAQRAVLVAAVRAKASALAAQRGRAAATSRAAGVVADTARRQALAVQDRADSEAAEVVAAATRAASRVASAVRPGQELEALEAAALVAQVTTDAAAATASRTALVAAATARATDAAALGAAAVAAEAERSVEREFDGTARAVQQAAAAAATQVAVKTHDAAGLVGS